MMQSNSIPAGARGLSIKDAGAKFGRGKSWVWDKIKNDPAFPRPVYLGPKAPVLLEHELDAWLAALVRTSRGESAAQTPAAI